MRFVSNASRTRLYRLVSLAIVISVLLTLLYCLWLYGLSSSEFASRPGRIIPIMSIDVFIEGEDVQGSGNYLYSDATIHDPHNSSELASWLARLLEGPTWEHGSFCDSYFGHTFSESKEICNRVQCRAAAHSNQMGTCIVKGLALLPSTSKRKKWTGLIRDLSDSNSFWLARGTDDANVVPCPDADLSSLDNFLEKADYTRTIVRSTVLGTPKTGCQRLFLGTTFFFMGMETHIYFKFLAWYNLHKALLDNSDSDGTMKYQIVRFPEGWDKFRFPEFEQRLFPNVIPLNQLEGEVSCFEKVVLAPWAYAAPPFRCRIDKNKGRTCRTCKGGDLVTDLKSFRERVLGACGLPPSRNENSKRNVVVVKRKAYVRHQEDKLNTFKRVWKNANEFVTQLGKELPDVNVTGVFAEELPICTQIELAYRADILVGLHGAGLVHLWWMKQGSHVVEFMPSFEAGNVAFDVLSNLVGIKMHSMQFSASASQPVNVPMDKAIAEIRRLI